jgi:hypothetical protein
VKTQVAAAPEPSFLKLISQQVLPVPARKRRPLSCGYPGHRVRTDPTDLALVVKIKLESSGNVFVVKRHRVASYRPEAIEREAGQIGETQKATPQLSAGIDGMEGTKRLTHLTSFKQPEAI